MNNKIKKAFAVTFVQLILSGRRSIEDVPVVLQDMVKANLDLAKNQQV
ncbi:CD1375 family protein [Paenibacillus jamilae]|nr:CD1375 family protein [Paenibacillus polymyxa]